MPIIASKLKKPFESIKEREKRIMVIINDEESIWGFPTGFLGGCRLNSKIVQK